MATRAVRYGKRPALRRVHRISRLVPGGQMAVSISAAGRREASGVVIADVASGAGRHLAAVGHEGVRVRQCEPESGVVELAVDPLGDGVALGASSGRRGEARFDVIRHTAAERRRAAPLLHVAVHALGRARVQHVIVADVAGNAGRGCRRSVRSSQRETSGAVIKG